MRATKRDLIGRRIVGVDWQKFRHFDNPNEVCHDPILTLDNGRKVWLVVEETGGPEYGVSICISDRRPRAPKKGVPAA